jgi:MarR family 2-MHQ and catechol resistance regulon transcriptional repressor
MKKIDSPKIKQNGRDLRTQYYWDRTRRYGERYREFHWPSVALLLNLIHTYDVVATHFAKRVAKFGLSISAFNVLMILSRSDEKGMKQNELSHLMLVSRANITGLIDSLVRQGLVSREQDATDRRVCIARITPQGAQLLESLLPSHYAEIARIAGAVNARGKAEMNRLLDQLRTAVDDEDGGRS